MHAAAIFDMDGLLIDSERSIMRAWQAAAHRFGVELSVDDYLGIVGRTAPEAYDVLTRMFGGGGERFEAAREHVFATLEATPPAQRFPLKRGALELLRTLAQRRVPCAVASSSARADIDERLTAVGVRHFFASVTGGDEVPRGKPDPAIYALAAQRLDAPPQRCLVFEDSRNGARAALAAGATLVLVPDLLRPDEALQAQALRVLGSLDEAIAQVERWFEPAPTSPR